MSVQVVNDSLKTVNKKLKNFSGLINAPPKIHNFFYVNAQVLGCVVD
jgi:hypothetical protein